MKRLMPSSLITFLQTNPNFLKADLFAIDLPNGRTLYATEGQWDITVPSSTPGWSGPQTTFYAAKWGLWERGPVTSEASFKMAANSMSLTCIPQQGTQYPGLDVGILNAALNHLFDAATVRVYTAYMPMGQYGNVSAGIETKFYGTITKAPGFSRNKIEFECADPFYLLNIKVPKRLMQAPCPWIFGDSNCGLDIAHYTLSPITADASSTRAQITQAGGIGPSDDYFTQGVITCLTGANAGLSQTIKSHKSGVIVPMVPWVLPVSPGDTFSAVKGCGKTSAACSAMKWVNGTTETGDYRLRFGGTPFTPVPSTII